MATKFGLGRGLDALIGGTPPQQKTVASTPPQEVDDQATSLPDDTNRVHEIPVRTITTNDYQPRVDFDEEALNELAESIKEYGIIQPLVVDREGEGYRLIAGERRLRASKKAGLDKVPAIIRQSDDRERCALAILENIQRVNLNPIEEALSFQRLMDEFEYTQADVSKKLGKSRAKIANTIRLLRLHPEVQQALREGRISEGHGKIIASANTQAEQLTLLNKILIHDLSVSETADVARPITTKRHIRVKQDPNTVAREDRLREALGTKVSLRKKGSKGKIVIDFYSDEELANIIDKIA